MKNKILMSQRGKLQRELAVCEFTEILMVSNQTVIYIQEFIGQKGVPIKKIYMNTEKFIKTQSKNLILLMKIKWTI